MMTTLSPTLLIFPWALPAAVELIFDNSACLSITEKPPVPTQR